MFDVGTLSAALGSAQAAGAIIKSMVGIKTNVDINSKAIELQSIIISLQADIGNAMAAQMQLVQESQQLKNQLVAIEDFHEDAKRYKLYEAWSGSLVYALKQSMSAGDPAHYLCTRCYQAKQKSILSGVPDGEKGWTYYRCPACKSSVATHYRGGVPAQYPPE